MPPFFAFIIFGGMIFDNRFNRNFKKKSFPIGNNSCRFMFFVFLWKQCYNIPKFVCHVLGDEKMDCKEAQSKIDLFVKDNLDIKTLKLFLDHVEQCDDCKDELEVYFTLYTGMQILEDEKDSGINYRVDLERKLRRAEDMIRFERLHRFRKVLILIVIALFIAIMI